MKVRITQEDINNGVRYSFRHCPIAIASTRAMPFKSVCYVNKSVMFIYNKDHEGRPPREIQLPSVAQKFIEDFDQMKEVQPIDFDIAL